MVLLASLSNQVWSCSNFASHGFEPSSIRANSIRVLAESSTSCLRAVQLDYQHPQILILERGIAKVLEISQRAFVSRSLNILINSWYIVHGFFLPPYLNFPRKIPLCLIYCILSLINLLTFEMFCQINRQQDLQFITQIFLLYIRNSFLSSMSLSF